MKTGLRQWRKHGQGVWRIGTYHGLDGWSFWSIGLGRNAVLIECSGERLRYVVIEVADAERTVRRSAWPRPGDPAALPRGPGTRLGDTGPGTETAGVAAMTQEPRQARIEFVNSHRLDYESHRAALERECEPHHRLERRGLAAPGPDLSGLECLRSGRASRDVFSFWSTQLEVASPEAPVEPVSPGAPAGVDVVDWLEGRLREAPVRPGGS